VISIRYAAPAPASLPLLVQAGGAVMAEEEGHIVGYAVLNLDTGELDAAFVEPSHQGRGIALQLLRQLESMARERALARLFVSASLNAVPSTSAPASCRCAKSCIRTAAGSISHRYSWKSS